MTILNVWSLEILCTYIKGNDKITKFLVGLLLVISNWECLCRYSECRWNMWHRYWKQEIYRIFY